MGNTPSQQNFSPQISSRNSPRKSRKNKLKCGPGTIKKDNVCVIDFGEKFEVKHSGESPIIVNLDLKKGIKEDLDFKIPYKIEIQKSCR